MSRRTEGRYPQLVTAMRGHETAVVELVAHDDYDDDLLGVALDAEAIAGELDAGRALMPVAYHVGQGVVVEVTPWPANTLAYNVEHDMLVWLPKD